jgi:hypothetical protein
MKEPIESLLEVFTPNTVKIHPEAEVVFADRWIEIATLSSDCAFFIIHIVHTLQGDGVMIAFKDEVQDINALGPFFGDTPPVSLTLPPTSRIYRRTRVHHIYAKLNSSYYVPKQDGQARECGPHIKVEEWRFFKKQGQTDEKEGSAKGTSADSYSAEVAKGQ